MFNVYGYLKFCFFDFFRTNPSSFVFKKKQYRLVNVWSYYGHLKLVKCDMRLRTKLNLIRICQQNKYLTKRQQRYVNPKHCSTSLRSLLHKHQELFRYNEKTFRNPAVL